MCERLKRNVCVFKPRIKLSHFISQFFGERRIVVFNLSTRVPKALFRTLEDDDLFGAEPQKVWRLEGAGDAPEAKARLAEWLKS